ncbi:WD40-repeat-containing domain protein [Gorgonomyces haynaldii]|nr:WD40-repeat-containing domain protein [Gorgonomyces haynaldii]
MNCLVSTQKSLILFEIESGTQLFEFKHNQSLAFQTCLVSNLLDTSLVYSAQDKALVHAYAFNKHQINTKIVVPEQITLCSSHDYIVGGGKSGMIYVWKDAQMIKKWQAHYAPVRRIWISSCQQFLVTSSDDCMVKIFRNFELLHSINHSLVVSDVHLGKTLRPRIYSVSLDKSLIISDTTQVINKIHLDQSILSVTVDTMEEPVTSLCLSLDENRLISGAGSQVFVWDIPTRQRLRTWSDGNTVSQIQCIVTPSQLQEQTPVKIKEWSRNLKERRGR